MLLQKRKPPFSKTMAKTSTWLLNRPSFSYYFEMNLMSDNLKATLALKEINSASFYFAIGLLMTKTLN